jgi:hypothetical protein
VADLRQSDWRCDALPALGLAETDSGIYTMLVGRPGSTSAELAGACGVSPVAAGRALGRLTRMGLARKIAERPARYLAVAPDVAISDLILRREAELNSARTAVHELMDTHREASRILHPDTAVDVLTDRDDISAMARRIQIEAQVQVRGFDRPPYIDRPGSNLEVQVERQRQGVRHRVVYDRSAVALQGRLEQDIVLSVRAGEQARVRPELPLKMILCDDRMGDHSLQHRSPRRGRRLCHPRILTAGRPVGTVRGGMGTRRSTVRLHVRRRRRGRLGPVW